MSGNGVARRLGLQQSAVRKALERLVARGVVTRTDVGRTAAYALDARREVVRRVVLPAFRAEAQLAERLRRALQRLALALRPRPAAVVLYGSAARGVAAPGDVDLLVVLAREEDEEPLRAALLDAARPIEVRFQLAVSPVVLTTADLAQRKEDPLIAAVAADGLLLSGARAGAAPPRARAAAARATRPGGPRGGARSDGASRAMTRKLQVKRVDRAAPRRAARRPYTTEIEHGAAGGTPLTRRCRECTLLPYSR